MSLKPFTDEIAAIVRSLNLDQWRALIEQADLEIDEGYKHELVEAGFRLAQKANGRDVWFTKEDFSYFYWIDDGEFVNRLRVLSVMES